MKKSKSIKATKLVVFFAVPIVSVVVVSSLLYYISIWMTAHKILIDTSNVNSYVPFIFATFLSSIINMVFLINHSKSLKRIENLVLDNSIKDEIIIKLQMTTKEELMRINDELEEIKGGVEID